MRAKLLKTPINATIRPIVNYNYGYGIPSCCNPEYTPFEEPEYEAAIHAVWFKGDDKTTAFLAIERDGKRLVVPSSFVSPWTVKDLFGNLEEDFIQSVDDARRYGLEAFAEDAQLMLSNFNVTIIKAKPRGKNCVDVKSSYSWEYHGHVEHVRVIEQLICFSVQDRTEIRIL